MTINSKIFAGAMTALALVTAAPVAAKSGDPGRDKVAAAIRADHAASIERLRKWIALPTIANMKMNTPAGADYMKQLALDAGFQQARIIETGGVPGVFATLDAGARDTLALYFMYDVKHFDPVEWKSPPLEGKIVDRPGDGSQLIGRGAVNQKGPEAEFLAALAAFRKTGTKLPVNLVLVAEGEEEIGSTNFPKLLADPEVQTALKKSVGIMMPSTSQERSGEAEISLGAKGVMEVQLISSGAHWGRGPDHDIHSSLMASVDSPAWRLVQALDTLVKPDGHTPAIDGWFDHVRPLSDRQKAILRANVAGSNEADAMKGYGIKHWIDNEDFLTAQMRLASQPTVNIQGLVSGYTGPGGKTVLPGRAEAKLDFRLVPDMTKDEAETKLKAYLVKKGFPDIEVVVSGGYSPNQVPEDAMVVHAAASTYQSAGIASTLYPRSAGSWPGVMFTGAPLNMAAVHFGGSMGGGAHAPNEWLLIDSKNAKVAGFDDAAILYADFLYEVARLAKAKR